MLWVGVDTAFYKKYMPQEYRKKVVCIHTIYESSMVISSCSICLINYRAFLRTEIGCMTWAGGTHTQRQSAKPEDVDLEHLILLLVTRRLVELKLVASCYY